jgi:hypothetical protein
MPASFIRQASGLGLGLISVRYDCDSSALYVRNGIRERINVTSSRDALDGYQKGKCLYCSREITIAPTSSNLADFDHFLPHTLFARGDLEANLDGIWNLVLSCRDCNRGEKGKSAGETTTGNLSACYSGVGSARLCACPIDKEDAAYEGLQEDFTEHGELVHKCKFRHVHIRRGGGNPEVHEFWASCED